jgi:hypothetical protein
MSMKNRRAIIRANKKKNKKLKEDNEKLKKKKEITRMIINDLREMMKIEKKY